MNLPTEKLFSIIGQQTVRIAVLEEMLAKAQEELKLHREVTAATQREMRGEPVPIDRRAAEGVKEVLEAN